MRERKTNRRRRNTYISDNAARIIFPKYLNEHGLLGEGVEVGVYSGWHANLILETWRGEKLYAVDPYVVYLGVEDTQEDWDRRFVRAAKTLERHKGRCVFLRTDSLSASRRFKPETLDWVYIDGRHDYDGVIEDIRSWLPKVKKGGVLVGHDYVSSVPRWPEVNDAVDDYFGDRVKTWPEAQTWYVTI